MTGRAEDAGGGRVTALERVRRRLREAGASDDAIDRAIADDVVDLLAVDLLIVPSTNRYTPRQVSEDAGLQLDILKRLWRALGFLETPDDEPALTDMDLEAARDLRRLLELGVIGVDTATQLARVIGSSMARVSEAELLRSAVALGAAEDSLSAADAFVGIADEALGTTARLLEFVWRRHTQAVARRAVGLRIAVGGSDASPVLSVGFADMVGFTLMSQHLGDDELGAVVRRFEEISYDIVTANGGRVVKTIGDEVMFVVDDAVDAARIGVGLADAYAGDDLLGDVRVGIAAGPVLVRDGDYFGPTVNLASRIVGIAEPGSVLVSDELHSRLVDDGTGEFAGKPLRPRLLKDVGRVRLWACRRPGAADDTPRSPRPRRRRGWERLGTALRDLDELRAVGERVVTAASKDEGRALGRRVRTGRGTGRAEGPGESP